MIVKLLNEHLLEFLSLKAGCRGSSESTHVKMPHCWKFYALAQIIVFRQVSSCLRYCFLCCSNSLYRVNFAFCIFQILTHKAPPIICSRRQFQILLLFQKLQIRDDIS